MRGAVVGFAFLAAAACGSPDSSRPEQPSTGTDVPTTGAQPPEPTTSEPEPCPAGTVLCGEACVDVSSDDANCGACGATCEGAQHCAASACASSAIEHVVIIVQENHTFDSYFGNWCTAAPGSDPACTTGPGCCEAGPAVDPGTGAAPIVLDDDANIGDGILGEDPNHTKDCEVAEIDGGLMDRFVAGANVGFDPICGIECSRPENFAYSNAATVQRYWDLAAGNAIADRYFQPTPGATTANTLYLLTAHWLFDDADYRPNSIGSAKANGADAECVDPTGVCLDGGIRSWPGGGTIADALAAGGYQMSGYIEGYDRAVDATADFFDGGTLTGCAHASNDCPYFGVGLYACVYEPADVPFEYFDTLRDDPTTSPGTPNQSVKDYLKLAKDVEQGTLPAVAYVHGYTFRNEHPKFSTISDGIAFVDQTIDLVEASATYGDNTLVLLVWDEGGGFFDHVDPVAAWPVAPDTDDAGNPIPHGTRVPLIAIGPFAAAGTVSHVVMDHSSIVKFLEYNFLPPSLWVNQADARVNNIGSLLDPTKTGIPIP
jgi:phospholipase C